MGQAKKKYWKGFEELTEQPSFIEQKNKEFREYIAVDEFIGEDNLLSSTNSNRRDFLKFLGFSVAAATVASCETPITKAIPYVIKPEESNPGVANYYASTYFDGNDYSSVLVKTREGRPIHIEGNPLSSVSGGRVNARVNSSVLSLYDSNRAQSPMDKEGNEVSWEKADKAVTDAIKAAVAKGGKIRLLSNTMISPTAQAIIDNFIGHYGAEGAADVRHVMFDNISYSGIIAAHQESFNKPYIPNYRFDKAQTIVSIGADFLSTWLSSIEYSGQYAVNRKPDSGKMSKHFQFETGLSVTGSNADHRTAVLPSEYGTVAINLHNAVAGLT
ncbi:MAG TPA: molybdopterin oxidoreductase, partial [Flavobacteriales bacterium]|nr:molybdopterin oxidoreductase [Flavobacteriales bacterium]